MQVLCLHEGLCLLHERLCKCVEAHFAVQTVYRGVVGMLDGSAAAAQPAAGPSTAACKLLPARVQPGYYLTFGRRFRIGPPPNMRSVTLLCTVYDAPDAVTPCPQAVREALREAGPAATQRLASIMRVGSTSFALMSAQVCAVARASIRTGRFPTSGLALLHPRRYYKKVLHLCTMPQALAPTTASPTHPAHFPALPRIPCSCPAAAPPPTCCG